MFESRELELWAGIECTLNRVGATYFDQLRWNGHLERIEDLEVIAQLGIKVLRYPVLWEHVCPDSLDSPQWAWPDERLEELKRLGITPIVGLLHHGSGPSYTDLLDLKFPEKLASYAKLVAERYPWIQNYTPVNEPLTTARFSGLYGHWYTHGKDDQTFARCLVNECRGIILAMREIRKINPDSRLIQTEDLGKTYCTERLQYQADFENERRWASFDLLTGNLKSDMLMWTFLLNAGISAEELEWFNDNPCPPDIIGINHYLTSDRFLDDRLDHYPAHLHGGNNQDRYVDEAAIRVELETYEGIQGHLRDAWERYHLPIAITEAHLGCTREEQLRWLKDFWESSLALSKEGLDIRAVTVWALLGSYDWNCLVTKDHGYYEPGAYDTRGNQLRPTAIVKYMEHLLSHKPFRHPLLEMPGWWQRADRYHYPIRSQTHSHELNFHIPSQDCSKSGLCNLAKVQPMAIIGANGTLGRAFARYCDIRGIPYYLLSRQQLDIANAELVEQTLIHLNPWAVINAAGYVRVDDAEEEKEKCWQDNVTGPVTLAKCCHKLNLPLVTFSSDLVFDGSHTRPYLESDPVNPINTYGLSKAEAEKQVLSINPSTLVIRTSAFFSPWDEYNLVSIALKQMAAGNDFVAARDIFISPTYVPDLVNTCLDLLIDQESGLWHLSSHTEITWFELVRLAARTYGISLKFLHPRAVEELSFKAQRPRYSVLDTEKARLMPDLDSALSRYIHELKL
jgi:dTDP-4-dehydrorhamnose reductase